MNSADSLPDCPAKKRRRAENLFRKTEIHDIIHVQLLVAEKQIQVGGRMHRKAVYSGQKEDDNNEFF